MVVDVGDTDADHSVTGLGSGIERHHGDFVRSAGFAVQRFLGTDFSC